ncbi:MAG: hypothetical protein ACHQQR_08535, partial [Gemmatimonadales bacterium]
MADAVGRYDEYRRGPHSWMLGNFVVPVARLADLAQAVQPLRSGGEPLSLAAIAGPDLDSDIRTIAEFTRRAAPRALVRAIEAKASTPERIDAVATSVALLRRQLREPFDTYVELPLATDPAPLIQSLAAHGLRAKARTGGVTRDAFPAPDQLARFLIECVGQGVAFKATAGLHHAMRGDYPLTYAPSSERGMMFGFLNVLLAVLLAIDGLDATDVRALLE